MEEKVESKISVIAAIAGNILVAIVKFIAACISGSVAMVSEGIHSIVDSGNGVLVLFGIHRSKKEPDYLHPFGYGKELYFWTLVVALLIFLLGGGISLFKGVEACLKVSRGTYIPGDFTLNYIVLFAAMIIEGSSLVVAVKQFNKARGEIGPFDFISETKDPSLYTVVLEDSAAELGLLAALASTIMCDFTGIFYFDGAASIFIGILLCAVSFVLLRETKGLLVGEGMMHKSLDEIRELVESDERIASCGRILTMYMGPDSLLITIDATFVEGLSADDVLKTVDTLENLIYDRWPQTTRVFIEAESRRQVLEQRMEEASWEDEFEEQYNEDEQPSW